MQTKTKRFVAFGCFLLFVLVCPWLGKALPVVRDRECYRSFFPRAAFCAKMNQPVPKWMQEQLAADFEPFQSIELEAIEATYRKIEQSIPVPFYRYRIFNNKLYSYRCRSGTDNTFEKALKTLLLYARVPNVDFIFCPMDGLPEPYISKDGYITERIQDQAPVFAKAKIASAPYIVLVPDQFSLSSDWDLTAKEILSLNQQISWEEKASKAMWRGGLTDIGVPNGGFVSHYADCPRFQISKLSWEHPEWVDAGLPWSDCMALDQVLRQEGVWKKSATKEEHLAFKYLPVLDGHMCTYPGYQWRLLSNSVCFKQESDQVQWFYGALKPYVHFIPVERDMSDLIARIEWAQREEELVRQIVKNAQDFALNHLMIQDDYLYLFAVLKRYAALQKIDWTQIKMDSSWTCIQYRKRQQLLKSWARIRDRFLGADLGRRDGKRAGNI